MDYKINWRSPLVTRLAILIATIFIFVYAFDGEPPGRIELMNTLQRIRVMLVHDHNVVRSGLATFLRAYEDLELVGAARNGVEAVNLCRQKKPDVILMDLIMPEMDGIAATRAILADYQEIKIIAMTSFEDEQLVQGVLAAGAISYLLKNVTAEELAKAIREAVSGRSTLSPEAARVLIQATRPTKQPLFDLTERELEVLNLVAVSSPGCCLVEQWDFSARDGAYVRAAFNEVRPARA